MGVYGFCLLIETDGCQRNGLCLKGGSVKDLGAGLRVTALQGHQHIRMGKDPFLGADAVGHTGLSQIGAGGAVQKTDAGGNFFVKFFSGEHMDTSVFDLRLL